LPTAAYIGGPAEIAYMAQAQVAYKALLGRMPAMLPRAGFTLIEPSIARIMKKYELGIPDILRGRQYVRAKMERMSLPRDLVRSFETDEKALRKVMNAYRKKLQRLDRTLVDALNATERKILYQFTKLKGKAGRAETFRKGVLDMKEKLLLDALYPHHDLQERTLSALPFIAAYGPALFDELTRSADLASPQHHILYL
jgi:bacillithiol synthase